MLRVDFGAVGMLLRLLRQTRSGVVSLVPPATTFVKALGDFGLKWKRVSLKSLTSYHPAKLMSPLVRYLFTSTRYKTIV